jgi:hypothetical protein
MNKEDRKVSVSIYCKIFTDSFSDEMVNEEATGTEIYEFLMRCARQCVDENGQIIPGDCNLWYLGCNEKFGELVIEDKVWKWSFGESSFENVEAFVSALYQKKLISGAQFHTLMGKIDEGCQIDNMYDIKDCLICKREGRSWSKTQNASRFRDEMKRFVTNVESNLQNGGYQVYR